MNEVHDVTVQLVIILQRNLVSKNLEYETEKTHHEHEEDKEPHDIVMKDKLHELNYFSNFWMESDLLGQFECHSYQNNQR